MNQQNLTVDFGQAVGAIKPMHAVNNGPIHSHHADQHISNLDSFQEAGIPYARTHDAAFNATYGGEHTVDIAAIFPNFDADAEDPASYDFIVTDEYLRVIQLSGAKVFYRLGSKIEHYIRKFNTLPPKDFHKWAVICEHIIRHYNEGWANGFHWNIEYWEIWNEPDLDEDDSPNKRCWGGTAEQFRELYTITARHLKACFPQLKIGGPAVARSEDCEWIHRFLELDAPLDFFSWHIYARNTEEIVRRCRLMRQLLLQHNRTETESILNEWNYVRGFAGDDWVPSLKTEKSMKGAAFVAAVMAACQAEPLDLLMYYDARPCCMNGMFNTDFPNERLKGYYPFRMFNTLYQLGESVAVESDDPTLYLVAAQGDAGAAIVVTYFHDDAPQPDKDIRLTLKQLALPKGARVVYSLLDETHDDEVVREECISPCAESCTLSLHMPLYSSMLIRILPVD